MRIPLVIGMPVFRRAWILNQWFDSLQAQDPPEGTRLIFAVSYDEDGRDDGTVATILKRWPGAEILEVPGAGYGDDQRDANGRYAYLAWIRNKLLRAIALMDPEAYLSWDSDVMLRPGALLSMINTLTTPPPMVVGPSPDGAIGALIDMGTPESGPNQWSWMELEGDDAYRRPNIGPTGLPGLSQWGPLHEESPPSPKPFQVDVIMAVKLMSRRAYRDLRYGDSVYGEDVAWAIQARAMNVPLWVAPDARGTHVLRPPRADAAAE